MDGRRTRNGSRGCAEVVQRLCRSADLRGKGNATTLLLQLATELRALGCRRIELDDMTDRFMCPQNIYTEQRRSQRCMRPQVPFGDASVVDDEPPERGRGSPGQRGLKGGPPGLTDSIVVDVQGREVLEGGVDHVRQGLDAGVADLVVVEPETFQVCQ